MAKIVEVQEVAVAVLKPYERNAKIHSGEQVQKIAESIKEFGFLSPCLIDREKNIIAGHGRVEAAKLLGMETVPCVFIEGLSDEQRRAYILADNKLTEMGEWDMDLVMSELTDLNAAGFDIEVTGFELELEEPEIAEDDFEPIPPEEPKAKLGEIYQLGNHRLMCGDSTSLVDVSKLMRDEKAEMVFTDPPWNVSYGQDNGVWKQRSILNDSMTTEDFKEFMNSAFSCMHWASMGGAMAYIVMSAQEWGNLMLTLATNGFHWSSTIIWNKDQLVLSRKDYHTKYEPIWYGWKDDEPRVHPLKDRKQCDVWDFDRPKRSDEHPTMKPVELVARAITNSSDKGDIVLDLFGGSGTTLIASEETDRRCFMMELDPKYVDVIIGRWEDLTGRKAVLLNE